MDDSLPRKLTDDVLYSINNDINAAFNTSRFTAAFESILGLIESQQQEIASLRVMITSQSSNENFLRQFFDQRCRTLEDHLAQLTAKTVGKLNYEPEPIMDDRSQKLLEAAVHIASVAPSPAHSLFEQSRAALSIGSKSRDFFSPKYKPEASTLLSPMGTIRPSTARKSIISLIRSAATTPAAENARKYTFAELPTKTAATDASSGPPTVRFQDEVDVLTIDLPVSPQPPVAAVMNRSATKDTIASSHVSSGLGTPGGNERTDPTSFAPPSQSEIVTSVRHVKRSLGVETAEPAPPAKSNVEYTFVPNEDMQRRRVSVASNKGGRRRSQMSTTRSKFLTPARRAMILRELRVRGVFIKAVRLMVVDRIKRERDTQMDLKRRIADIESSIDILFDGLQNQKKNIQNILPDNFIRTYQNVVNLTYQLDEAGGLTSFVKTVGEQQRTEAVQPEAPVIREAPMTIPEWTSPRPAGYAQEDSSIIRLNVSGQLPEEVIQTIRRQLGLIDRDTEARAMLQVLEELTGMKQDFINREEFEDTVDERRPGTTVYAKKLRSLISRVFSIQQSQLVQDFNTQLQTAKEEMKNQNIDFFKAQSQELFDLRLLTTSRSSELADKLGKLRADVDRLREEVNLLKERLPENDEEEDEAEGGLSLRSQLKMLSHSLASHQEREMKDYRELTSQLQKVQGSVEGKPTLASVEKMMEMTENTFKRQLGQNIAGVNQAVQQVVKAVQRKADKEEIARLIAKKVAELESTLHDNKEASDEAAGSTRCLSCGNQTRPKTTSVLYDTVDFDPAAPFRALGESQVLEGRVLEEYLAKMPGSQPHEGIALPSGSQSARTARSRGRITSTSLESTPERNDGLPLYRRARQAAQLKETVKLPLRVPAVSIPLTVPQPSQQAIYVLDDRDSSATITFPDISSPSRPRSRAPLSAPKLH